MSCSLITSDWHLSDNTRDSYRWEFQKWLRSIVKKHDVDRVIVLGDLTESKDFHSAYLVNQAVDCIAALARLCLVVILRGNHDGLSPEWPFFAFAKHIPNVTWISTPRRVGAELFLPHTTDYKKDWHELMESGVYANSPIHYYHQMFAGARSESGAILSGVPLDVIPAGVTAYSGDVHMPQEFRATQTHGSLTYVGAPYRIDWGDSYSPRILLLSEGGKRSKSIPVPGPQKCLIEIDPRHLQRDGYDAEAGDLVKIRVRLTERGDSWLECKARIAAYAQSQGWVVHSIVPVVDAVLAERVKTAKRGPEKSDEALVREFAKRQGLDERMLAAGISFLKSE